MARSEPFVAERFARLRRDNPVRANSAQASIRSQPPKAPARGFRFRQDRIGSGTLALVTRQLATLVRVMTVEESLRTIALQTERPAARRLLLSTHASVTEGYRLSDAMARQGTAFPPLYRAMIAAGESSGALPEILDRLADLLEHEQGVRSKMLTTLIYPAALSVTAIAVIIALMTFVVPRVVDQFASMGQTLPALTRIVIFVSNLMTQWGWLILLVLALCSWIAVRSLRNPALRLKFDGALLRLPLIGRLIRDLNAARLARTLSTMIASGLPVIDGLVLTARTINNTVLREAVETMASAIREGGSLSAAMRRAGGVSPGCRQHDRERREQRQARDHAGKCGWLSRARVQYLHVRRPQPARARHHHHHGRCGRNDRARHPPPHPPDQHALAQMRSTHMNSRDPIHLSREAGFTLVELMVVIVIIGLLATVVMINVLPSQDRAMVEKARADIAALEQAVDTYRLEMLSFPRMGDGLEALVSQPARLDRPERYRSGGYIRRLPLDPWGNPYHYVYPGRRRSYDVYSLGADGREGGEGNDADIGNW